MTLTPLLAIVGPTASGKTALALEVAERIRGEILNADAMQLYRGMDIGTAKTPIAHRRGIPHHQIDVLDVSDDAAVATYQYKARADIAAIRQRGRIPVIVGGSGLYLRALLDDMEFPETDADVRAAIATRADMIGGEALHRELAVKDPAAAAAIDPRNVRRVVRALEVIEITGAPFTATLPRQEYVTPTVQVALSVDRAELRQRIAVRVDEMIANGFAEEVAALGTVSKTAVGATGYPEMRAHIAGQLTLNEARDAIMHATARLAKRQMTWFRRDTRIRWFDEPGAALAWATGMESPR